MAERDYEVGYRRPPRASQFRTGTSGNPSGKRKASPSVSQLLDRILAERMEVSERGKSRRYTKEEVFFRQLVAKAISGDRQFARLVMDYLERRQQNAPDQKATHTDDFLIGELIGIINKGKAE